MTVINSVAKETPACTKKQYLVSLKDLPVSCPMPDMEIWNAHPRVYLPIEKTGQARCPYCEAEFFLADQCKLDLLNE